MRQMFDASQIMKVKSADTILKGLTTAKGLTITREQLRELTENADILKFGSDFFFAYDASYADIVRTGGGAYIMPAYLEYGNKVRQQQIVIEENADDDTKYDISLVVRLYTIPKA